MQNGLEIFFFSVFVFSRTNLFEIKKNNYRLKNAFLSKRFQFIEQELRLVVFVSAKLWSLQNINTISLSKIEVFSRVFRVILLT